MRTLTEVELAGFAEDRPKCVINGELMETHLYAAALDRERERVLAIADDCYRFNESTGRYQFDMAEFRRRISEGA